MGKLMALALLCTMAAAVLFQPALMGRPRPRALPTGAAFDLRTQVELGLRRHHRADQPADEAVNR
jgi:hypothetical protein